MIKANCKANWDPHIRTSIFGSIDNEGKQVNIEEDTANADGYGKFIDKIVELCPEMNPIEQLWKTFRMNVHNKVI
jgi:hypothetical protein